jgi:hypothetical protein
MTYNLHIREIVYKTHQFVKTTKGDLSQNTVVPESDGSEST